MTRVESQGDSLKPETVVKPVPEERWIPPDFRETVYAEAPSTEEVTRYLNETGFGYLVPLLNREKEADLLRLISSWVRSIGKGEQMPEALRSLLGQYKLSLKLLDQPSLLGIYGLKRDGMPKITELGKEFCNFIKSHPDIYFFLVQGIVPEALGEKPTTKARSAVEAASFDPQAVKRAQYVTRDFTIPSDPTDERTAKKPEIDLDTLLLCEDPLTQLTWICEDLLKRKLFKGSRKVTRASIPPSRRRSHFGRIELATTGQFIETRRDPDETWHLTRLVKGVSFGQLAFSKRSGFYSARFRLVDWLMSQGDLPVIMLVAPTSSRRENLFGVALDFHPERARHQWLRVSQPYTRQTDGGEGMEDRSSEQLKSQVFLFRRRAESLSDDEVNEKRGLQQRLLVPLVYHWPLSAFPVRTNFPEAWDFFLKEFRRWPWANNVPLMEVSVTGERFFSLQQALLEDDPVALRTVTRLTAIWFNENIIRAAIDNPAALGKEEILFGNAKAIIENLALGFDGDPYIAFLRCLSPAKSSDKESIHGMGIFELLPNLMRFLQGADSGGVSYRYRLTEAMANCAPGVARQGWKTFLNFLFSHNDNDALKVALLLTPFSLSPVTFGAQVLSKYNQRFRTLEDFQELRAFGTVPVRIIDLLTKSNGPLTNGQIANALSIPINQVANTTNALSRRQSIINVSTHPHLSEFSFRKGTRRKRATYRAAWVVGGVELSEDDLFPTYETRSQVYLAVIKGNFQTVRQVMDFIKKRCPHLAITDGAVVRAIRQLASVGILLISEPASLGEPIRFSLAHWQELFSEQEADQSPHLYP